MRVAFLNNRPQNGGIGQYAFYLHNALEAFNGHKVDMFQLEEFNPLNFNFINTYHNYLKSINAIDGSFGLIHASCPGIVSSLVIRKLKKFPLVTVHDVYIKEKSSKSITERLQERYVNELSQGTPVIFVSKFTADRFKYHLQEPEKSKIIHYGIDHSLFKPRTKSSIRNKLKLPVERKIVIYVGDTLMRKNLDTLFKVYSKLNLYYHGGILFLVIGGDRKKIINLSRKYNVDNILSYSNMPHEQVAYHYNASDLMIYPSLYEGFGMPALEAMSSSLPIISSSATSLKEIVGVGGILVDPLDVESYVDKSISILNDPEEGSRISNLGLKRSLQFDWKKAASDTAKFYDEILKYKL